MTSKADTRPDLDATIRAGVPRSRPSSSPIADSMRCPMTGCGRPAEGLKPADGEVVVYVAGARDVARIYCGGACAARGVARVELHHHLEPDARPRHTEPPTEADPAGDRPKRNRGNAHPPNNSRRMAEQLQALGLDPRDVRSWAVSAGVMPEGARGPLPQRAIDAYLAKHQPSEASA